MTEYAQLGLAVSLAMTVVCACGWLASKVTSSRAR